MELSTILNTLVNTDSGRLFLILLIIALPKFIDTIAALIRNRGVLDKAKADIAVRKTDAQIEEEKRIAEMAAAKATSDALASSRQLDAITNLITFVGETTKELRTSNAEQRSMSTALGKLATEMGVMNSERSREVELEKQTFDFRVAQAEADRAERQRQADADRQLIREQTSIVAENTNAFSEGIDKLASTLQVAQKDSAGELTKRIEEMGEQFSNSLAPVDEQLAAQTKILSELKVSVDALRESVDNKLSTNPAQFQSIQQDYQALKTGIETIQQTLDGMTGDNQTMQRVIDEIKRVSDRLDAMTPPVPPAKAKREDR